MNFQCDVPDCDDPVTVHASIDRRDAAVGVMWDRVDVDSIVYPDGREVHYSDLPDAVLAAAEEAGDALHRDSGLDDFPEPPGPDREWLARQDESDWLETRGLVWMC